MAFAMAWPCVGPNTKVRKMSKSSVPCSSSMRSFSSLVDIPGEAYALFSRMTRRKKYAR
jgi:hypothetical protein